VGHELLDAVVRGTERVLAQHRPLGLVLFWVPPVHFVVAASLLRSADELAA
jgi:hypothetical protein